jgi:hypothetical protein
MLKISDGELRRKLMLYKSGQIKADELAKDIDGFLNGKKPDYVSIEETIIQFHIRRGCCDGNPSPDCLPKTKPKRKGREKQPNEFEGTE